MSTDDKWLDIGYAEFHEIAEEFNQLAPYGFDPHVLRPQEVSFSFKMAEDQLKEFSDVIFDRENAYAEIKRLFKPRPYLD